MADIPALHQSCWSQWPLDAVQGMLARVLAMMERQRALGLVAVHDEQAIAYGQLTRWPRTAEISDLVVAEAWREQGIGTQIICTLIDIAHSWQASQVEIGVTLNNPRAFALYRRLGFQENRTVALDLGHGLEQVHYLTWHGK